MTRPEYPVQTVLLAWSMPAAALAALALGAWCGATAGLLAGGLVVVLILCAIATALVARLLEAESRHGDALRDATLREQAVSGGYEVLEAVLQTLPVPVVVQTGPQQFLFANQAWRDLFGHPGNVACDAHAAQTRASALGEDDAAALASGGPPAVEQQVVDLAGQTRWMLRHRKSVTLPDGEPVVVVAMLDFTAHRDATAALEHERAFLDRLIDAIPQPLFMKDRRHRLVKVNAALCRAVGRSREELIGASDDRLVPREIADVAFAEDDEVFATGRLLEREVVRGLSGGHTWQVTKALLRAAHGEDHIVGTLVSLDGIKAEQANTERHRAFLESMLHALPMPLAVRDRDLRWVIVNDAMLAMLRMRREDVIGRDDVALLGPELAARTQAEDRRILAEGGRMVTEELYRMPDGRDVWGLRAKQMLIAPDGDPLILVAVVDITERRVAEVNLKRSAAFLDQVLRSIPWSVLVKDHDHRYVLANQAALQFTGRPAEALIGRTDRDFFLPPDAERNIAQDDELLATQGSASWEEQFRMRDGSVRWVLKSKRAFRNGEQGFVVVSFMDITERRRIALELQRHREHLEELVAHQTSHLLAAKETAERANRTKSDFLANMSHELRTPMHAVLAFAQLGLAKLERAPVPREQLQHYLGRITESGRRLLALLNDLLDLSKLEAGKMRYEFALHRVAPIVEGVLAEMQAVLRGRRQTVLLQADEALSLKCDADRLAQVVRNLLSNASKFTPEERTICIAAAAAQDDDGVPVARITVSDPGIGIPEEEVAAVFDKFVQSSKTRSGAGGTGLGLSICREIVHHHGGTIRAANNPGGGAVFTVDLPLDATMRDRGTEIEVIQDSRGG